MPRQSKRISNEKAIDVKGTSLKTKTLPRNTLPVKHHAAAVATEQIVISDEHIAGLLEEGWTKESTFETEILEDIYPGSTDHHLLSKHLKARGFLIINDLPMELEVAMLDKQKLKDADYIFELSRSDAKASVLTRTAEKYHKALPRYNPNDPNNNFFGRSYVVAVIDEFGKVYAISVSQNMLRQIPTTRRMGRPQTNLHTFNNAYKKETKNARKAYSSQDTQGRYSKDRKNYIDELRGKK